MTLPAWLTERRQSEAAAATATAATALTEGAPNTGTGAGNSGAERSGSELSAKPLVALEKACIKESGVLSAGLGYVIDGFNVSDTANASSDEVRTATQLSIMHIFKHRTVCNSDWHKLSKLLAVCVAVQGVTTVTHLQRQCLA
eukprot:10873-Heterococcus_DN1.PRE.2